MKKMTVIGITGGTGAGKTTALDVLRERGALVIDCDEAYHRLLTSSEPMLAELRARFPQAFVGGVFDRKALGRIVFADSQALAELNAITHKYVDAEVDKRLADWSAAGGALAAIDAIALIESGLHKKCSHIIGVIAPPELRARRIALREGISPEYAMLRINAQKPESYFRAECTDVLVNDCPSAEEFKIKCAAFFDVLLGGNENV